MKKALSLIFLIISLTMVYADCTGLSISDSTPVASCCDCPHAYGHFESSHSHGQEDHITTFGFQQKTTHYFFISDFQLPGCSDLRNNYFSTIWQPPKFS
ncbi:MAG TPA: hypothetical protein VK179_18095 [Bacteroidales bacterium]|nr:hypothetical protein [Bacteroidales bacterium]